MGDGAVGKTSLCHRFTDDYFAQTYKQTVGLDWFSKQVQVSGGGDGIGCVGLLRGHDTVSPFTHSTRSLAHALPRTQIALPGDVVVSLQIWDIGGQQIGSPMMKVIRFDVGVNGEEE